MVARVYLTDVPSSCDKLYDYRIPEQLLGEVTPGSFVVVPFGGGNRSQAALVMETSEVTDVPPEKLKPIITMMDPELSLSSEFIGEKDGKGLNGGLLNFMVGRTFCSPSEALRTILPAPMMGKIKETYTAVAPFEDESDKKAFLLYIAIRAHKLPADYDRSALKRLIDGGFAEKRVTYTEAGRKMIEYISLAVSRSEANEYIDGAKKINGPKSRELLRLLLNSDETTLEELKFELKSNNIRPQLNRLLSQGLIKIAERPFDRDPYSMIDSAVSDPAAADTPLTDEQEEAAAGLTELAESGEAKAALLYGVTGSGKTRVIKRMIDVVTSNGRGVIVLVPEIGLTPQTVSFFRSFYGKRVVVTHSGLSDGERFDAWRRLRSGEADICIGTRSAVFAPIRDLGMIVIDEEQEHTYKSDSSPRYHARDIARFLCAYNNSLMLLASATPSLDSICKTGYSEIAAPTVAGTPYSLFTLRTRYSGSLPEAIIADTRPDAREGFTGSIGRRLRYELADNLARGEQSILFLNRRGYNMLLRCPSCGKVMMCPECSVSLTYHTSGINRGMLCCHYCGHREDPPLICPDCGGTMSYQGTGTQKVEEELHDLFPDARILRMDADTTAAKFSSDELLDRFRRGDADILLGTQMVAKGHDFPRVTLVGVISADMSLYLDDYRANEMTFSLLTQVIGRAGRARVDGRTRGRAVIQTFSPDHPVIRLAASQDYDEFCRCETAYRRAFGFPPYCELIAVTYSSDNETSVMKAALAGSEFLRGKANEVQPSLYVFGPIEAPLYKLNGRYRMRLIVKCRLNNQTRAVIAALGARSTNIPEVSVSIDVNPNMM
nr:primosomal protein N' [Clostridia bacterium]